MIRASKASSSKEKAKDEPVKTEQKPRGRIGAPLSYEVRKKFENHTYGGMSQEEYSQLHSYLTSGGKTLPSFTDNRRMMGTFYKKVKKFGVDKKTQRLVYLGRLGDQSPRVVLKEGQVEDAVRTTQRSIRSKHD